MFYYLFYNSTFSFIENNRLFSTILYGSIIYIISHAIINYCNIDFLIIIRNYFWPLFSLDILTFGYCLYNTYINVDKNSDPIVSFNLLKNKINNIITSNTNTNPIRITPTQSNINDNIPKPTIPNESQKQFKQSTPISVLRNFNNQDQKSLINEKIELVQPKVTYDENESIAGSDVASVLDLDDFEKSL
jgi:hypothetical protein